MKKILVSAVAAMALLAAGSASAEGAFSFNLGVTNDYVWRGVSQTDEKVAFQGGVDYTKGIFYAGTWVSNVDFGSKADIELDLYAGIKPTYGDWAFDLGVLAYTYPQEDDINFEEIKLGVSHPLGKGTVGFAAYVNTDDKFENYYELNGAYPITEKLSLSGAYGDYGTYTTWNFGGSYTLVDGLALDVRYHDTDLDSKLSEGRAVASLKLAF
ncbi:MAG: TorF family putative porin [Asticcacaulis sp.]